MKNFTQEELLDGLAELAEMVEPGYLTQEYILMFKQHLAAGSTIKEAQNKVIYDTTL